MEEGRMAEAEQALQEDKATAQSSDTKTSEAAAKEKVSNQELQELGDTLAQKEADLVAARWTIGQLRQEVVKS